MKAIQISEQGGPEVLNLIDIPVPQPKTGEALVKNEAIGVNFVDVQHRAGLYYPVALPLIPGTEAAGVIEAVGPGVSAFKVGDRVGYAGYMGGNYAEYTVVPETQLLPIPAGVDSRLAAAVLLQGMTAHCMTESVYPVQAGDRVLIHAAAGGVGLLLTQLAKRRGATVIGTVSNAEKAQLAREMGCDYPIIYTQTDFAAETMRLTGGQGVRVVYDSVSGSTFEKSLGVLQSKGYMVVFGQSGGQAPLLDITHLSGISGSKNKGSLFLTWATLSDYTAERADLLRRARDVLTWVAEGSLKIHLAATLPLAEAAAAHRLLESRGVAGKFLLLP